MSERRNPTFHSDCERSGKALELEDGRMMKYGRNDEIEETQRENPENPKRKWGMGTRDGKTHSKREGGRSRVARGRLTPHGLSREGTPSPAGGTSTMK